MAKKIYYGQKAFPGGMPRAAASNQGQAKQQTYYDGYPVTSADVLYFTVDDQDAYGEVRNASTVFDDGSESGYDVNTHTYPDGSKSVFEYGSRNGVDSFISNHYDPNGNRYGSDTTYNKLQRGDIGFEQLQRQFEGSVLQQEEPLYPGTPDADINQQTPSTSQAPRWKQVLNTAAKYVFPGAYALTKIGQKAAQVGASRMKQGGQMQNKILFGQNAIPGGMPNTTDWKSLLSSAPNKYPTNGGTAVRDGNNYYVLVDNGGGKTYNDTISKEDWEMDYLSTQGFIPTFDDNYNIIGYKLRSPQTILSDAPNRVKAHGHAGYYGYEGQGDQARYYWEDGTGNRQESDKAEFETNYLNSRNYQGIYDDNTGALIGYKQRPGKTDPNAVYRQKQGGYIPSSKRGYLRLQKQGGKLTEVWTPFN